MTLATLRSLLLALACFTAACAQALTNDSATTLLLRFENTFNGAAGELPTLVTNATFVPVVGGTGASIPTNSYLTFNSTGNINSQNGTLECWIRPNWDGNDGNTHDIFLWLGGGGLRATKDGANNLRLIANVGGTGGLPEFDVDLNVGTEWLAGVWHHVAFTWTPTSLKLYVDGRLRKAQVITGLLNISAGLMFIGDGGGLALEATLDELRISNRERTAAEILQSYLGDRALTGAPAFSVQPQSQTLASGQALNLSAVVTGILPFTYQWYQNGALLPGATSAGLSLPNLGAAQVANFTVVASNIVGGTTSRVAAIVVDTGVPADTAYTLSTLAGTAEVRGYQDGQGAAAQFNYPQGIALDTAGNAFVADYYNVIRRVTLGGTVTTFAGAYNTGGTNDGLGSVARFAQRTGIASDRLGNFYVADENNHTIRKISPTGDVTTLAGNPGVRGSLDGVGGAALFDNPSAVAVDETGNVFVADMANDTIRKITPAGEVSTFAGTANQFGTVDGYRGAARFNVPWGVAVDLAGNVYVTEIGRFDSPTPLIRKITPDGYVTTLAGAVGQLGFADGQGSAARFDHPRNVSTDPEGNIYVGDQNNHAIRKITPAGRVSTLLFQPGYTYSEETLWHPRGVAADAAGNVYIADYVNSTIRKATRHGSNSPLILSAPTDTVADEGGTVTLTVSLANAAGATYQWMKDNVLLPGANSPTLQLANISRTQAGRYALIIQKNGLSIATRLALLSVRTPSDMYGKLLFSYKDPSQASWNLWTISAKGTGLTQLTTFTNGNALYPRISPDATRVAFTLNGSTGNQLDGIWVASLVDGSATRVVVATNFNTNNIYYSLVSPGWLDNGTVLFNGRTNAQDDALWQVPAVGGVATTRFIYTNLLGNAGAVGIVRDVSIARSQFLLFYDAGGIYPTFAASDFNGQNRSIIYENRPPGKTWAGVSGFHGYGLRWHPAGASVGLTDVPGPGGNFDPIPVRAVVVSSTAPTFRAQTLKTENANFRGWSPDGTRALLRKFNYFDYGHAYGFGNADDREPGDFWVAEPDGSNPRPITNLGTNLANGSVEWFVDVPEFTSAPLNRTVMESSNATFTASVLGVAPFTYQWLKDGVPLPGATGATLALTNLQLSDAGNLQLRVSNGFGTTTSTAAALTVVPLAFLPRFTASPADTTNRLGFTVTLTTGIAGNPPLFLQWQRNNTNLLGETNQFLTLAAVQTNQGGAYRAILTNSYGRATSAVATVTVFVPVPLTITNQPVSRTVLAGTNVSFSIGVTGTGPVVYQWVKNGVALAEYGATLSLTNVSLADAGNYQAYAYNDLGSIASAVVTLAVQAPPVFLSTPQSVAVGVRSNAFLRGLASGVPTPGYYWLKDGVRVTNAVGYTGLASTQLTALAVSTAHAGNYFLVATNAVGAVTSAPAALTVLLPPQILTQPQSVAVNRTNPAVAWPASFTVLATNADAHAWFQLTATGALPLTGQPWVTNADTATLGLPDARRTNAGGYFVVLTNLYGVTTSSLANLRVRVPASLATNGSGPALLPGGRIRLTFGDAEGGAPTAADLANVEVQYAVTLAGTNTVWTRLPFGFTSTNGQWFVEDNAPGFSTRRYYRVIER